MRKIKFRAYCEFDGIKATKNKMVYFKPVECDNGLFFEAPDNVYHINEYLSPLMQFTGLKDKNGKEIYEGDRILIRAPYRTTQTHTGDNIPNGSYTEPMEPEIDEFEATIEFKDGAFILTDFESEVWNDSVEILLGWVYNSEYSEEEIKDAIRIKSKNTDSFDFWDEPEDNSGDLQYLLGVYPPNNLHELIEYLKGVEVIGNIHENKDLLK